MKHTTIRIGGLLLWALILLGCHSDETAALPVKTEIQSETAAPLAESAAPVPSAASVPILREDEDEDEERILSHCISIADALPFAVDLDGDGTKETVDMVAIPSPADDCPRWTLQVAYGQETKRFQTEILDDMPYDLWVGDLDEDGAYELFFHGDLASNDYILYAWRHDLTPILFEPDDRYLRWNEAQDVTTYSGYVDGFEDGHIVIEGVIDMLGTHWGVRNFAIGDDGVIGPVSSVWEFDEAEDRFLTVKRELTAYAARVRKDPGEPFILAPGEKIYPLASDGCERMWFETASGKSGVLLLTPDEENLWRIDGVPEADCFEFLPYSG